LACRSPTAPGSMSCAGRYDSRRESASRIRSLKLGRRRIISAEAVAEYIDGLQPGNHTL